MSMIYTELEAFVRARLPERRFIHSLGVVEMSRSLSAYTTMRTDMTVMIPLPHTVVLAE